MAEDEDKNNIEQKGEKDIPKDSDTPKDDVTTSPLIARAEEANKKKEELLEREEKLIARKEKLQAEQMVGGGSPAGGSITPQEETPQDYAKKVMNGEVEMTE